MHGAAGADCPLKLVIRNTYPFLLPKAHRGSVHSLNTQIRCTALYLVINHTSRLHVSGLLC
jgi:hypothetical protein